MDVAEAYAWGQKFLLGYGKHPPLSGWVAGVWFMLFPVTDWATYALAMATLGCGLVICWLLALRVVDRRRAFFVFLRLGSTDGSRSFVAPCLCLLQTHLQRAQVPVSGKQIADDRSVRSDAAPCQPDSKLTRLLSYGPNVVHRASANRSGVAEP